MTRYLLSSCVRIAVDLRFTLCYNTACVGKDRADAGIAQSVEQLIRNQQVVCSSHIASSMKNSAFIRNAEFFAFDTGNELFRLLYFSH